VISKAEIGRAATNFLLLAAFSSRIFALNPGQPFSRYIQTRFTPGNGFGFGVVHDIVQSSDGFLWVTAAGGGVLIRFDGQRFFELPVRSAKQLAVTQEGDLWFTARDTVDRAPAAALNQFGTLPTVSYHFGSGPSNIINCLYLGRSGVLWAGAANGLYRYKNGGFDLIVPSVTISRIEETPAGHLLLCTSAGFIEWDGSRAVPHPEFAAQLGVKPADIFHVLEDRHGVLWFCTTAGVARKVGGSIEKLQPFGPASHGALRAFEDREGTIWFATTDGLFRAAAGGLELVAPGMNVRCLYEDRDGDLWIGTNGDGLIRLRDPAVQMFTTADGLPNRVMMAVLERQDGTLWTGANCGGVSRLEGNRFRTYSEKDGLLNSCVFALAEDASRDLWIGTWGGGAFRLRNGAFTQFSKPQGLPGDVVTSILPARDGSVWFGTNNQGVARMWNGQIRSYTVADGLSSNFILSLFEDTASIIWVGTREGLDHWDGDRFINIPSLPKSPIATIGEGPSGSLYLFAYPGGIFRMRDNHTLNVAPDLSATTMLATPDGDVWLPGVRINRVRGSSLGQLQGPDEPLDWVMLGQEDGLTSIEASSGHPNAALDRGGKLWIATPQGLAMLDLPHQPKTSRKPRIYMEDVTVGRNSQPPGHEISLLPGTHHVEFCFDAIEISAPEKIRLQYRLDSVDTEWLDAGRPAHATYSNIPPGRHSFHIRACDRDGIWDRTGTVYRITQLPYFYQTRLFQFGSGALLIVVLAGAYRLRIRQIAATMNSRFDERLAERTRIARDFHDTLLQTIQASKLVADDALATNTDPGPSRDALSLLSGWLGQATEEGRSALNSLRSSTVEGNDLAEAFRRAGEECSFQRQIEFAVSVEGSGQEMHPIVRDEVYRIGYEAVRNACTHSGADRVAVELSYLENLVLRIHDNGKGIDPNVAAKGRGGHFGLVGMYERAARIKGKLTISSSFGAGTDVELVVPRSIVFQSVSPVRPRVLDNIKQFFVRPFRRGL
jgi:signal transduction histidine kinase/ligand-binding sensor domain-containing protein